MRSNRAKKVVAVLVLAAVTTMGALAAPKYPSKTITFVAPSGAGGAFDMALRAITKTLTDAKLVDQQMLVEAKPGGGGSVFLAEYVTKDVKNDYKLFLTSPTMLINNLRRKATLPSATRTLRPSPNSSSITPLSRFPRTRSTRTSSPSSPT